MERRSLLRRRRVHQARPARIDINTKAPMAMPAMAPALRLLLVLVGLSLA
jgi:hypothetical protein